MAYEIERKFLVKGEYKSLAFNQTKIIQGYICSHSDKAVRVRVRDDKGYLTIKGATNKSGITKYEWEKEINLDEARELLLLCDKVIEKTRFLVKVNTFTYEVDEFYGDNNGLVVAEIELNYEDEIFDKPIWLGKEVSGDLKYYNSRLINNPYCDWEK